MNQAEWLSSSDPRAMLRVVLPAASERKLRLFACACARCYWHDFDHPRCRQAIEATERYADDSSARDAHRVNSEAAAAVARASSVAPAEWISEKVRRSALRSLASAASQRNVKASITSVIWTATRYPLCDEGPAGPLHQRISDYLRDVFGIPWADLNPAEAALARNDPSARHVAQSIYDDRAFDQLPILADALEDAGCTEAAILDHCRGPGPHVRGCWVVDLVLGKA